MCNDSTCKDCQNKAHEIFLLDTNIYQGCHYGMFSSNSFVDKIGSNYIDIYKEYSETNLDREMTFLFYDHSEIVSKTIIDFADNVCSLYKNSKKQLAYKNSVVYDLDLIKRYCYDENMLVDDMEYFKCDDLHIVMNYIKLMGIIYEPIERAAQMLLRILVIKILRSDEITEKIKNSMKKNPQDGKLFDIVVNVYTKKYIKEVIKYFVSQY